METEKEHAPENGLAEGDPLVVKCAPPPLGGEGSNDFSVIKCPIR